MTNHPNRSRNHIDLSIVISEVIGESRGRGTPEDRSSRRHLMDHHTDPVEAAARLIAPLRERFRAAGAPPVKIKSARWLKTVPDYVEGLAVHLVCAGQQVKFQAARDKLSDDTVCLRARLSQTDWSDIPQPLLILG